MNKQQTTIKELSSSRISNNSDHKIKYSQLGADQAGHVYRYYPELGWEVLHQCTSSGYGQVYIEGVLYQAHDVIWACFHGPVRKNMVIHHVDGNSRNNSIANLKMVSIGTNISYFFRNSTNEHAEAIEATRYKYPYRRSLGIEFFIPLSKYNLEVSNRGTVRSLKTGKEIQPIANVQYPSNLIIGYYKANGKHSSVSLARLFAEAFMKTPKEGKYKVLIKDFEGDLYDPTNYFIYQNDKK